MSEQDRFFLPMGRTYVQAGREGVKATYKTRFPFYLVDLILEDVVSLSVDVSSMLVGGERVILGDEGVPGSFFARKYYPRIPFPRFRCSVDQWVEIEFRSIAAFAVDVKPVLYIETIR